METYQYSFACGPTLVDENAMSVFQHQIHPSYKNHLKFLEIYKETQDQFRRLINVDKHHQVYFQTGESVLGIWSCLKSFLKPKDKVTIIQNGYYSQKIHQFINNLDYECTTVNIPENESTSSHIDKIKDHIQSVQPKLVIVVHCETNSGILNPILDIGELCSKCYLMVDFVSSVGGMEIEMKDWGVDFGIFGTHKCLNLPPDLAMVVTSPKVQKIIQENNYGGYDGLCQFHEMFETKIFPYCPNYHSILALHSRLTEMERVGFQQIYAQHEKVSKIFKDGLDTLGLELYPKYSQFLSPFVTSVQIPKNISWKELNQKFLDADLLISVGLGNLKKKVFRIGHMGIQADEKNAKRCLKIIEKTIEELGQSLPSEK